MNHAVRLKDHAARMIGQAAVSIARPAIRWTPFAVQRLGMETILNEIFALPIAEGRLEFLEQRSAMIEVLDVGASWVISLYRDRLLVLPGRDDAEVVISGNSAQFLALGLRTEDPDMFFFQRQLKVRGDTELGLAMKNFIDSIDEEDLPPIIRYLPHPLRRRLSA